MFEEILDEIEDAKNVSSFRKEQEVKNIREKIGVYYKELTTPEKNVLFCELLALSRSCNISKWR